MAVAVFSMCWRVDIVGMQNNDPEGGDIGEVAILWGPILA